MIPAVWRVVAGRSELPSNDSLAKILVSKGANIPPTLRSALRVEKRLTDYVLANMTEIIAAGQSAGCWSRQNPTAERQFADLSFFDALRCISDLELDFPEEVAWLKDRIHQAKDHIPSK
jgi:hypothetical protein